MCPAISNEEGLDRLTVVVGDTELAMSGWEDYAHEVGQVLGLEPSFLLLPVPTTKWSSAVLPVSAGVAWPVLVLPPQRREAPPRQKSGSRLTHVHVASDGSPEMAQTSRHLARELRRHTINTTVVVVLTAQTTPPIWEGPGHHAAIWRTETEWRHGHPNHLDVVTGRPEQRIPARLRESDLVVLAWHQVASEDRAAIVRAVIDEPAGPPCLLVPSDWIDLGGRRDQSRRAATVAH